MIEQLQKVKVFKYCKTELLDKIAENIILKEEAPGTTILNHGDESKSVYIIFEGSVMIIQLTEEGKVVGLELAKSGGCFGEMSAIDGSRRSASVVSLGNVRLGILNHAFFKNYVLKDYDFCRGLLAKFARVVRRSNQQVFSLSTASAKKRLLLQVVRLSSINKLDPSIMALEEGLSHTTIGSFAGISRETVTRLIGDLKSDKIIWTNKSGHLEMNIEKVYKELSSLLSL